MMDTHVSFSNMRNQSTGDEVENFNLEARRSFSLQCIPMTAPLENLDVLLHVPQADGTGEVGVGICTLQCVARLI